MINLPSSQIYRKAKLLFSPEKESSKILVHQGRILTFSVSGVGGFARGVGIFFAANAAHSAPLRGTSLVSSNCRLSDILEINFLICLGTYFVRELIRQPWLYSKM